MTKPNILVLSGYGINCEEETAFAFDTAGANSKIVHINDLASDKSLLNKYQVLVIPGGFSFGDDIGAGKAMANMLRLNLEEKLREFVDRDTLTLGICNGFQVLVSMGLLPALYGSYQLPQVDLLSNDSNRYTVRWVDIRADGGSPWLSGVKDLELPIAHGEGKFFTSDEIMQQLNRKKMIAFRYVDGNVCKHFALKANPNGALEDVAGITDESGRILGMMPHPERAISFTQLPYWTFLKDKLERSGGVVPSEGPGMQVFRNAVKYFG